MRSSTNRPALVAADYAARYRLLSRACARLGFQGLANSTSRQAREWVAYLCNFQRFNLKRGTDAKA